MVGQDRIIEIINKLSIDTFPRTLMLEGDDGCGKHTLCSIIGKKLGLDCVDITNSLTLDTIWDICEKVEPYIYIIDTKSISIREENVVLKFLEEPLKNAFIIVLCTRRDLLLDTIQNRCVVWTLDKYTKDTLGQFLPNENESKDFILELCNTPGQVIKMCQEDVLSMKNLAVKIFLNIGHATLPNTLTLLNHVAFKGEKDKFDYNVFFTILLHSAYTLVKENKVTDTIYSETKALIEKCHTKSINIEYLFANYLVTIRQLARG